MDGLCVSLWLFQREKNKKGSDLYCSVMSVKPEGGNSQVLEYIFIKKKETKACSSQAGWLFFFFVPSVVVSWCIPPSKKKKKENGSTTPLLKKGACCTAVTQRASYYSGCTPILTPFFTLIWVPPLSWYFIVDIVASLFLTIWQQAIGYHQTWGSSSWGPYSVLLSCSMMMILLNYTVPIF